MMMMISDDMKVIMMKTMMGTMMMDTMVTLFFLMSLTKTASKMRTSRAPITMRMVCHVSSTKAATVSTTLSGASIRMVRDESTRSCEYKSTACVCMCVVCVLWCVSVCV